MGKGEVGEVGEVEMGEVEMGVGGDGRVRGGGGLKSPSTHAETIINDDWKSNHICDIFSTTDCATAVRGGGW